MKKSFIIFPILIIFATLLSGCSQQNNYLETSENEDYEQKNTTITITGKLTKSGSVYFITDSSGEAYDVETYSVDFDSYLNQTITASGQYSGDTLFVSKIEQ